MKAFISSPIARQNLINKAKRIGYRKSKNMKIARDTLRHAVQIFKPRQAIFVTFLKLAVGFCLKELYKSTSGVPKIDSRELFDFDFYSASACLGNF